MVTAKSNFLFVVLVHILTTPCLGSAKIEQTGSITLNIRVKLTDYLLPFVNCTVMVFTPHKVSWGVKSPPAGPIISLVYDAGLSLVAGKMILKKFSLSRRRNKLPHCWTTFAILPELVGLCEQKNILKCLRY